MDEGSIPVLFRSLRKGSLSVTGRPPHRIVMPAGPPSFKLPGDISQSHGKGHCDVDGRPPSGLAVPRRQHSPSYVKATARTLIMPARFRLELRSAWGSLTCWPLIFSSAVVQEHRSTLSPVQISLRPSHSHPNRLLPAGSFYKDSSSSRRLSLAIATAPQPSTRQEPRSRPSLDIPLFYPSSPAPTPR